jgi:hypothetical protein
MLYGIALDLEDNVVDVKPISPARALEAAYRVDEPESLTYD